VYPRCAADYPPFQGSQVAPRAVQRAGHTEASNACRNEIQYALFSDPSILSHLAFLAVQACFQPGSATSEVSPNRQAGFFPPHFPIPNMSNS
jgi:hypothetical protein